MTSEQTIDNIVRESCNRCFPVEIWSFEKHGILKYSGNLLPLVEENGKFTIRATVDLPENSLIPPMEDTRVKVFFIDPEGVYSFETGVLGWKATDDSPKHGLVNLAYPEEVRLAQRRNFFRVPLPTDSSRRVNLKVKIHNEVFVMKGRARDVSGGGMSVRTVKAPVNYLEKGTRVQVDFQLPGKDESISLPAVLVRRIQETGHYFYGLKFVDHFKTSENRASVNAILQYIAQVERLIHSIASER
jgi:c-di-GMP-binding flagellar brake protein YcgR